MSKFVTPKGKEVATFVCPKTAHIRVKFVQGGELPEALSGLYTSERLADLAISQYLEDAKLPRVRD